MDDIDNFGYGSDENNSAEQEIPAETAPQENETTENVQPDPPYQRNPYGQPEQYGYGNNNRQQYGYGNSNPQQYGYGNSNQHQYGYGNSNQQQYGYGTNNPPPRYGQYNQQPQRRYDDFMYEPIGFEGLEKKENAAEAKPKKSPTETAAVLLFIILVIFSLGFAVFGIIYDISNSQKAIDELVNKKQVVLYRENKPSGANDPENFKDENGRYTTEGVAQTVRPSIVQIYTYKDMASFKARVELGTGSGVVLSEDGYIVTNAHVLKEDGYHTIETTDGDIYPAKIIGRDSKTDIAVIKVDEVKLQPATLGNSDETIVGEEVIAIGNPASLSSTVTNGIVSAVNRKIKGDTNGFEMNCIQTNADISPGNSGGALVNMYGQVIGITSSKYVSSSFEGLGFAITINEAVPIIEELMQNGYIGGRFRIGITLIDMSSQSKYKSIEEALGFELPEGFEGIYVDQISEDSDIKNTELKAGDFITEVDGTPVKTYTEFHDTIDAKYKPGDKVPATCAHIDENGEIKYYNIEFKIIEDTSGNY